MESRVLAACEEFVHGRDVRVRRQPLKTIRKWTPWSRLLLGLALLVVSGLSTLTWSATYTVTNTNNSGAGSLRQAILDANGTAQPDTIIFNIPTTDPGWSDDHPVDIGLQRSLLPAESRASPTPAPLDPSTVVVPPLNAGKVDAPLVAIARRTGLARCGEPA